MASYVEQTGEEDVDDIYDILLAQPKFLDPVPNNDDAVSSKNEDETPIFSKRKMMLRIPQQYTGNFMHLTVCKNWLVCLLQGAPPSSPVTLLRFFLPRALPPGGKFSVMLPFKYRKYVFLYRGVIG